MDLPTYEEYMLPALKFLDEVTITDKKTIFVNVAKNMKLSEEQMNDKLPSQTMPTYINRIGWALTYLKMAGLIESPERAIYKITSEGKNVLKKKPLKIDNKFLNQYESFSKFKNKAGIKKRKNEEMLENKSPDEIIECNYNLIKANTCNELLDKILNNSPYAFEKLVVDLVVAMGYGGNIADAGKATKKSGDGGVDGVINEDKLGLGKIYLQAKRYTRDNLVGSPEIQTFIGTLQIQGAKKGIFITTSDFSRPAKELLNRNANIPVAIINGEKLVNLMFEHNLGVSVERSYEIKKIDSDYFDSIYE